MGAADQATPCKVPLRSFEWAGLTRPVHAGIIGDLEWIRHQWLVRGGQRFYEIRSWWGYARRDCRTGAHPRGVALDVNPAQNPNTDKVTPCPTDMPAAFVELFKARGFGHGADWRSECDAMHFSKLTREGGDGRLYVPAGALEVPPPPFQGADDMPAAVLVKGRPKVPGQPDLRHHVFIITANSLAHVESPQTAADMGFPVITDANGDAVDVVGVRDIPTGHVWHRLPAVVVEDGRLVEYPPVPWP